jgi:nucleoside phosphorylase
VTWQITGVPNNDDTFTWTATESADYRKLVALTIRFLSPEQYDSRGEAEFDLSCVLKAAGDTWLTLDSSNEWSIDLDQMRLRLSEKLPAWVCGSHRTSLSSLRKAQTFDSHPSEPGQLPSVRALFGFGPPASAPRQAHSHVAEFGVLLDEKTLASIKAFRMRTQNSQQRAPKQTTEQVDVVFVCAVSETELNKLLRTGSERWTELTHATNDPQTYHTTEYHTPSGKSLRVIAAAPNHMGAVAASAVTTKMILRFRPRLVAMVGIAAGARAESQGFGDILVAEYTFDYGSGKLVPGKERPELKPEPQQTPIDSRLLARLTEWQRQQRHVDEIRRAWQAAPPNTALRMHLGPLASGSAVLNTRVPIEDTLKHSRKLIGIEMEAYGVHHACRNTIEPAPMFLCMKSICDFAEAKDNAWQDYAAYTSAELCYRFVTEEWDRLFPDLPSP